MVEQIAEGEYVNELFFIKPQPTGVGQSAA